MIILLNACTHKSPGLQSFPPEEKNKEGFTKATIINYTVDGCSWLLELEDGKKLQPETLDQKFQKDKLKVWIKYTIKKGGVGICMTGEMVNITAIEER